jgi:hypothetical protein
MTTHEQSASSQAVQRAQPIGDRPFHVAEPLDPGPPPCPLSATLMRKVGTCNYFVIARPAIAHHNVGSQLRILAAAPIRHMLAA